MAAFSQRYLAHGAVRKGISHWDTYRAIRAGAIAAVGVLSESDLGIFGLFVIVISGAWLTKIAAALTKTRAEREASGVASLGGAVPHSQKDEMRLGHSLGVEHRVSPRSGGLRETLEVRDEYRLHVGQEVQYR